jgi:hypothetical protein
MSCPSAVSGGSRGVLAAAYFLATFGRALAMPQRGESIERSSSTGLVSPAVVATWMVRRDPNASSELDLLVLWRGSPGWFLKEGAQESSGGSSSSSAGGENDLVFERASFGGIRLQVVFDGSKRTALVQDNEVELGSDNVILVDDVDGANGPQVARSMKVDGHFAKEPAEIDEIVSRNPELYEFLRCDARVPDANVQPMIDAVCERMKPR